ncbi:hypothetical protein EYR97_20205 [Alteromonas sp. KUL42]|nr:hypothetical protein EYR97_20205 [Alteromonas sp. KUL42]
MKPCIVYLAQNTKRDSQYGRDSRSMLEMSLDLLYLNYNDQFKHDILIFHEGDFDLESQKEVRKGRDEIKFQEIHFQIPSFLKSEEIPILWDGKYGLGHRHMARFYSVTIFHILSELGYDWFMRMDDDSFIHSKINYNLFEFMDRNGYQYGYRAILKEPQRPTLGFSEAVFAYIKAERLKPKTFLDNFDLSTSVNYEYFSFKGMLKKRLTIFLEKLLNTLNHDFHNWPLPTEWNRLTYYNNFLITNINFWMRRDVQAFVGHFDRLGGTYKYRWTDHILHTAAVQIYLSEEKVFQFDDWTYEHATIKDGNLEWGGIFEGKDDKNNPVVKDFIKKYGKARHDY